MRPLYYSCSLRYEPETDLILSLVVQPDRVQISKARASGFVLLVGIGSYVAYRLCLKFFGCRDFASLLRYLSNERSDAENAKETAPLCKFCGEKCPQTQGAAAENQFSYPCDNCGGIDRNAARNGKRKFDMENFYDSSESETESKSAEENPTEITDLTSEGSEENIQPARVNAYADTMKEQRKRWRSSVRKVTNALDDPDCRFDADGDEYPDDGFSNSRSPPPIPRFKPNFAVQQWPMSRSMPQPVPSSEKAPSVKSLSVQSVPSSQQLLWDPICTPGEDQAVLNDELLAYFADVPTGELVQRFLDGLFLSSDQNRVVSPSPSEAVSEYLGADKQLGDGTAANFEQLQCDFADLSTDVAEFDAELTTYLKERSGCLLSDSRIYYQSVVVTDSEDQSASMDEAPAALNETDNDETPSPSPLASPSREATPSALSPQKQLNTFDGAADYSPCHRLSVKRQKSHDSSTGSSEDPEACKKLKSNVKAEINSNAQNENQTRIEEDPRCTNMVNEKSAYSLDAGYASYHTMLSSADSGQFSPSPSVDEEHLKRARFDFIRGIEQRPTNLPLFAGQNYDFLKNTSSESGKELSSFMDSLPSSSGLTPDDWRKRSPSAISLEWEDEMEDGRRTNERSPLSCSSGRKSIDKNRLQAFDLMEFLRTQSNVDDLKSAPKIYQFGRKLMKNGYKQVLLHNAIDNCHKNSKPTRLDHLVMATLIGAAHFRWPLFKCHSFKIVPEAVDVSMKRCSFFAERCSTYFRSTSSDETRAKILQCMQKLWQLHESVQRNELQANSQRVSMSPWSLLAEFMSELIDGMKILMALKSLETYEEILFTRRPPSSFYNELFRIYTPASYAERKLFRPVDLSSTSASSATDLDDLDIALLADTLGIRIEMFRPNSSHPESVAVYPELEHGAASTRSRLPLLETTNNSYLFLPLI